MINQEIEMIERGISGKKYFEDFYNKFSSSFLFSLESPSIFSGIDLKNKSVLAVAAGSGDPMLYALSAGAKTVDLFDISIFPKYVVDLKMAALRNLTMDDFIKFFNIESLLKSKWAGIDYDLYCWVRDDISENTRYLFDKLGKNKELIKKVIDPTNRYTPDIKYLEDKDSYNKARKNAEYKPVFNNGNHTCDFFNLPQVFAGKKYDFIYLSNICSVGYYLDTKTYFRNLEITSKMLNPNGNIFVNYIYFDHLIDFEPFYKNNPVPGMDLKINKYYEAQNRANNIINLIKTSNPNEDKLLLDKAKDKNYPFLEYSIIMTKHGR